MLPIEMDLTKIERLAIKRESENFAFRMFLKGLDDKELDKIVQKLNREVTSRINCLECGNCCNSLVPRVNDQEIELLAALDNVTKETFTREHLDEDKYNNSLYLKATPCRYLDGKSCTIYSNRPLECRVYPYTHKQGFVFRMLYMITNYAICPIVFNVLENLKVELNYK